MFHRVTLIGVGLLGASLGLALKERRLARRVVGVGRKNSASLNVALRKNAIDEASTDPAAAAKGSDLVVLCTPLRQFPETLRQIAPVLDAAAIVTDVGSTKAQVMAWAQALLPPAEGRPVFIGSHPMAGSEKRGPQHARADLYQNALCLLCAPAPASSRHTQAALEKIECLWHGLGMRTLTLPPQEHDRWVATISHLPHAVAFTLVNTAAQYPAALQAVAGGFLDTTRIASSDLDMWTDIFLTNKEATLAAIDTFMENVAILKQAIATQNEPTLRALLAAAKKTRDALPDARKTPCPT